MGAAPHGVLSPAIHTHTLSLSKQSVGGDGSCCLRPCRCSALALGSDGQVLCSSLTTPRPPLAFAAELERLLFRLLRLFFNLGPKPTTPTSALSLILAQHFPLHVNLRSLFFGSSFAFALCLPPLATRTPLLAQIPPQACQPAPLDNLSNRPKRLAQSHHGRGAEPVFHFLKSAGEGNGWRVVEHEHCPRD